VYVAAAAAAAAAVVVLATTITPTAIASATAPNNSTGLKPLFWAIQLLLPLQPPPLPSCSPPRRWLPFDTLPQ
jgi:hypothetical protein